MELKKNRVGVQMLYFNCDEFILHAIDNTAEYVDIIYILYSPVPWVYNDQARNEIQNVSSLDILKKSKFFHKIKVIEGVYNTEEDQRNEGLQMARADGINILVIQDPDEFYFPQDFQRNLQEILRYPEAWYYRNPWYLFWKRKDHVIKFKEAHGQKHTIINYNPAFALNCDSPVSFRKNRLVNTTDATFLEGPCFHLSYYLSDEQLLRKVNTWGHADQLMDKNKWFKYKWKAWNPNKKRLNPFNPIHWERAVNFDGEVPKEISGIPVPDQTDYSLNILEKLDELIYDGRGYIYYLWYQLRSKMGRYL